MITVTWRIILSVWKWEVISSCTARSRMLYKFEQSKLESPSYQGRLLYLIVWYITWKCVWNLPELWRTYVAYAMITVLFSIHLCMYMCWFFFRNNAEIIVKEGNMFSNSWHLTHIFFYSLVAYYCYWPRRKCHADHVLAWQEYKKFA